MALNNLPKYNTCGTCIGGEQMMFGCYDRCMSCKGTGICIHDWDNTTSKYEGKMWNVSGTKEIPQYHKTWCKNCGAFLLIEFLPSGKEKSRKIDANNWHP